MPPRVRATSIVDAVVQDLRDRIFHGHLEGGLTLTEAGVAGRYDVARPTARAAIEKLVAEGLLERGPHRAARVPVIGPDDVRDIYDTRRSLESDALRTLAASRTVPAAAREANREISTLAEGPADAVSALAIVEPDMRLHASLVDAVGSPRLSRMYGALVGEVRLCMTQVQSRSLLDPRQIAAEHEQILSLLAHGEGEQAVTLLEGHLARARDRLAATLGA